MHEQNIICSKRRLDGTTHEQIIICRQLFAGHVVDSWPIEGKEKTHRMIMIIIIINQTLVAIIVNFFCSMSYCRFLLFSCKS